jgi:hypothetical protein
MEKFIAWALADREVAEGRRSEHVSFPSFFKNFALTNQSAALAEYAKLLGSSELSAGRRQALQSAFNKFKKHRLPDFWSSWTQRQLVDKAQ